MPGKKETESSYSYVSPLALYREVLIDGATHVVDADTQAAIAALPEVINMAGELQSGQLNPISVGRDNALILGVLLPTAITSATIKVFVDMKGPTSAANSWAKLHEQTVTLSTHIALSGLFPGAVKVLVTAVTGTGTVTIVYSRSA